MYKCKGCLACNTNCDTAHAALRSSSRTRDVHTCWRAFGSENVTNGLNDLHRFAAIGIRTLDLPHTRQMQLAKAQLPRLLSRGNEKNVVF